jgi:hypothetical protein
MAEERKILVPLTLPAVLPGGTGAADLVTELTLRGNGKVRAWSYTTTVVATGVGATRTPNMEIGTVDITGSDGVALALADADAVGETKVLGAPTGANEYKDGDKLSVEVPSGGTAFTAGQGFFTVWVEVETRGI